MDFGKEIMKIAKTLEAATLETIYTEDYVEELDKGTVNFGVVIKKYDGESLDETIKNFKRASVIIENAKNKISSKLKDAKIKDNGNYVYYHNNEIQIINSFDISLHASKQFWSQLISSLDLGEKQ